MQEDSDKTDGKIFRGMLLAPSRTSYLQNFHLRISIRGGVTLGRVAWGPYSFAAAGWSPLFFRSLAYDEFIHPSAQGAWIRRRQI